MYTKIVPLSSPGQYYPGMILPLKNGSSAPAELIVAVMLHVHKLARTDIVVLYELVSQCLPSDGPACDTAELSCSTPLVGQRGTIHPQVRDIIAAATQLSDGENGEDLIEITVSSPLSLDRDTDQLFERLLQSSGIGTEDAVRILQAVYRR